MPHIVYLREADGPSMTERVGGPGDLGCPACPRPAHGHGPIVIVDGRDRWWHAGCAAAILGQHTRHDEKRGEPGGKYHYAWQTPPDPEDLDPKRREQWLPAASADEVRAPDEADSLTLLDCGVCGGRHLDPRCPVKVPADPSRALAKLLGKLDDEDKDALNWLLELRGAVPAAAAAATPAPTVPRKPAPKAIGRLTPEDTENALIAAWNDAQSLDEYRYEILEYDELGNGMREFLSVIATRLWWRDDNVLREITDMARRSAEKDDAFADWLLGRLAK